jgi:hypothetical protein
MDVLSMCSGAALFFSLFSGFPREIVISSFGFAADKIRELHLYSQFNAIFGDHAQPNLN